MSEFKVFAAWQEIRELWFDSLEEANAWAEKLLDDEPAATVSITGARFNGSWYSPSEQNRESWEKAVREREAVSPTIGTAA